MAVDKPNHPPRLQRFRAESRRMLHLALPLVAGQFAIIGMGVTDVVIADSFPAESDKPKRRLSFIGVGHSGSGDLSRRNREIRAEKTAGLTANDFWTGADPRRCRCTPRRDRRG